MIINAKDGKEYDVRDYQALDVLTPDGVKIYQVGSAHVSDTPWDKLDDLMYHGDGVSEDGRLWRLTWYPKEFYMTAVKQQHWMANGCDCDGAEYNSEFGCEICAKCLAEFERLTDVVLDESEACEWERPDAIEERDDEYLEE